MTSSDDDLDGTTPSAVLGGERSSIEVSILGTLTRMNRWPGTRRRRGLWRGVRTKQLKDGIRWISYRWLTLASRKYADGLLEEEILSVWKKGVLQTNVSLDTLYEQHSSCWLSFLMSIHIKK
jgi:hypothetical protein